MCVKITLEEHFWTGALRDANRRYWPLQGGELADNLGDLGPRRLADMDAAGIDVQVLSVLAPAAQELDPETSVALSRDANDRLAERSPPIRTGSPGSPRCPPRTPTPRPRSWSAPSPAWASRAR